ncbi:MAG: hypothetical protein R3E01_34500 [Pirellulaceae bacterium]
MRHLIVNMETVITASSMLEGSGTGLADIVQICPDPAMTSPGVEGDTSWERPKKNVEPSKEMLGLNSMSGVFISGPKCTASRHGESLLKRVDVQSSSSPHPPGRSDEKNNVSPSGKILGIDVAIVLAGPLTASGNRVAVSKGMVTSSRVATKIAAPVKLELSVSRVKFNSLDRNTLVSGLRPWGQGGGGNRALPARQGL